MRPPGDPTLLAAAARGLAAAADELERLGRQATAVAGDLVDGGGWDGPASRAYLARDGTIEAGVRAAASALRATGEGLAGLSAGLGAAQTTWDRARALAASAGLGLDAVTPSGRLGLSLPSTDPRVVVAARASELFNEADEQAIAADRMASARLAEAARVVTPARPDRSRAVGPAMAGEPARHGEGGGSLVGRALDLADRVGVALGAGFAAIDARAQALLRLVRSGREPAAALGAVRALAAFERPALAPALVALLPVAGPPLTLAANLADDEHGDEPLLRAVVRSLGESIGADAGQRLGMAACGVDLGVASTAGPVLCPAVTIVTTSVGAGLGGAAAVRIYDALGPEPGNAPAPAPEPRPGNAPGPEPGNAPAPAPEPGPGNAPGPGSAAAARGVVAARAAPGGTIVGEGPR
jgi:hypothetical protein